MRFWEQGLVATYSLPGYKELIRRHYDGLGLVEVDLALHGVRDPEGSSATAIAGEAVKYASLHRQHELAVTENARKAEELGFDAVVIGV